MFERIFGVGRRRALQLMHDCGGWQASQAYLVDRLALLQQLERLQNSPESVVEQRRRQRLSETLNDVRQHRAAARVTLPVAPDASLYSTVSLPSGVHLQPGRLEVEFDRPEDLLARLYELAQVAARNFDEFRKLSGPAAAPH